jgi:hypothetical protein
MPASAQSSDLARRNLATAFPLCLESAQSQFIAQNQVRQRLRPRHRSSDPTRMVGQAAPRLVTQQHTVDESAVRREFAVIEGRGLSSMKSFTAPSPSAAEAEHFAKEQPSTSQAKGGFGTVVPPFAGELRAPTNDLLRGRLRGA